MNIETESKCRSLIQKPLILYRALSRSPIILGLQNQGFLNQVPTLGVLRLLLRLHPDWRCSEELRDDVSSMAALRMKRCAGAPQPDAYPILYYTILYYTILSYPILSYPILSYPILYYTILYYTILYYTILYYTILYYTIPKHTSTRSGYFFRP